MRKFILLASILLAMVACRPEPDYSRDETLFYVSNQTADSVIVSFVTNDVYWGGTEKRVFSQNMAIAAAETKKIVFDDVEKIQTNPCTLFDTFDIISMKGDTLLHIDNMQDDRWILGVRYEEQLRYYRYIYTFVFDTAQE